MKIFDAINTLFDEWMPKIVDWTMIGVCALAAIGTAFIILSTVLVASHKTSRDRVTRAVSDMARLPFMPDECITPALPGNWQSTTVLRVLAERDYDYVVQRIEMNEPAFVLHKDSQEGWARTICQSHLMNIRGKP